MAYNRTADNPHQKTTRLYSRVKHGRRILPATGGLGDSNGCGGFSHSCSCGRLSGSASSTLSGRQLLKLATVAQISDVVYLLDDDTHAAAHLLQRMLDCRHLLLSSINIRPHEHGAQISKLATEFLKGGEGN